MTGVQTCALPIYAGQGRALREAALAGGFREASTGQDLTGRDRFLRAVR